MVLGGVYIIKNRNKLKETEGKVITKSYCEKETISNGKNNSTSERLSCTTIVTYTADGVLYENISIPSGSVSYIENQKIKLWYDSENPNNPTLNPTPAYFGYILITIAVIMVISSWSWVYITQKSKLAASATGTVTGINFVKDVFNN
jgi:hypothetical protein